MYGYIYCIMQSSDYFDGTKGDLSCSKEYHVCLENLSLLTEGGLGTLAEGYQGKILVNYSGLAPNALAVYCLGTLSPVISHITGCEI